MIIFLSSILIILSLLIIGSVLLQKSSSMGLGAYTSDVDSKYNLNDKFLEKATISFIFIWISIILYISYYLNQIDSQSVII